MNFKTIGALFLGALLGSNAQPNMIENLAGAALSKDSFTVVDKGDHYAITRGPAPQTLGFSDGASFRKDHYEVHDTGDHWTLLKTGGA